MFLVDAANPGVEVTRRIGSIDHATPGGHCEVVFDHCTVDDADGARRGRPGVRVRPGPAQPGPPDPLHALARIGPAGEGRGARLGRHPLFGHPLGVARNGPAADRGLRDRPGGEPRTDLARRCGARLRRPRCNRIVRRQDVRRRGGLPGGRPRRPDVRRLGVSDDSSLARCCAKSARSASTTARPKCTAGRSRGEPSAGAGARSKLAISPGSRHRGRPRDDNQRGQHAGFALSIRPVWPERDAATCGTVTFPAQASCAKCTGSDMARVELPDRGTLWTWTVQAFEPEAALPRSRIRIHALRCRLRGSRRGDRRISRYR